MIGIPRALLYYKYGTLWENFFEYLNIPFKLSPKTNKEIIDKGIMASNDEACLSFKIFMGHVSTLANECDYILIPRVVSIKKKETLCTNFYSLYDVVENTYNVKVLLFNVDIENKFSEEEAFINMAKDLNIPKKSLIKAYLYAKEMQQNDRESKILKQDSLLKTDKLKILIAGHPYNLYDEMIGTPIVNYLKSMDIAVLTTDVYRKNIDNTFNISKDIYWTYNKEIFSNIEHYASLVDGIIILSTFPCGTDSLCNEMIVRKVKNIPIITLIIDEGNNKEGIITRLESFVDILNERRKLINEEKS